jgi:hypothetical protein
MSPDQQQALVQEFARELDKRRSIDEKRHANHHAFIETLIEREKRAAERWEAVKTHIAKWGAVGVLSGCLLGLWFYLQHKIKGG